MPKQDDLAGVEGPGVSVPKIKAVEEAFDALIGARTKRMSWGEKEGEASAALVELFHKHNLRVYTFDDKRYTLKQIEKIKLLPKDEVEED
jgi:hypothetical protein